MALAKWRETSQNLFCPICMHHLLLFSLPLSTFNALLDWDRIFASWLLLGLVKRGNCLQRKCTKTKIRPFHHLFCGLYCNEDHLHLMIYCSPFNGCVDIINFLFDQNDWRNWRKTLWNCGKIIWGDEILQLKFIEIGVRERVLAAPQPTGGRDWFAKTSPRKHFNITIVVLQHNNTI